MQMRNMQMMQKRKGEKSIEILMFKGKQNDSEKIVFRKMSFDFKLKRKGRRYSKYLIEFGRNLYILSGTIRVVSLNKKLGILSSFNLEPKLYFIRSKKCLMNEKLMRICNRGFLFSSYLVSNLLCQHNDTNQPHPYSFHANKMLKNHKEILRHTSVTHIPQAFFYMERSYALYGYERTSFILYPLFFSVSKTYKVLFALVFGD